MRHDSFTNATQNPLTDEAWTFDSVHRYEPTRCAGLTPSGKAYSLVCEAGVCTLTIAGRTRSVSTTAYTDPVALRDAWRAMYAGFPKAQQ